jgi:type VI secretion system protein ImpJ
MNLTTELHWKEGLFIQPHHFQIMQRSIAEGFARTHQVNFKYPYGIIKLQFQEYKLENEGIMEFSELEAAMASGLNINISQNTILNSRSLKNIYLPEDKAVTVYLGIPLWCQGKKNTFTVNNMNSFEDKIKRYLALEEQHYDENSGINGKNIFIRKYNASIFFEGENMDGFEILPLLKIKKKVGEGKQWWSVDSNYIPSCLYIRSSDKLKKLVNNIVSDLKIHTMNFTGKLHESNGFESGSSRLQRAMLKLFALNTALSELILINDMKNTTPLEIYTLLYNLTASMCALIPKSDFFNLTGYIHDQLLKTFQEINKTLFSLLEIPMISSNYRKITFEKLDGSTYCTTLNKKQIADGKEFYLCISTKMEKDYLIESVENGLSFKVMPFESIRGSAIPGFKLIYQHTPPEEFPQKNGSFYFYIKGNKSEDLWGKFLKNRQMGIFTKIMSDPKHESLELFFKSSDDKLTEE